MPDRETNEELAARVGLGFPSSLDPTVHTLEAELVVLSFDVGEHHHAANGYLHAGAVVTLADTACGYGTLAGLPDGADGFTTVELKSNHLSTVTSGQVTVTATRVHAGRSTQVWDATITGGDPERTLALFRCTQMILYPR